MVPTSHITCDSAQRCPRRNRRSRAALAPGIATQFATAVDARDIGCSGCAEVQWLERVEVRSDIECPRSGTARPVAERYPLLIDARMDVKEMFGATRLGSGQDRDEPLEVRAGAFSVTRPGRYRWVDRLWPGSGSAGHLLHNPRSGVSRFVWARRPARRSQLPAGRGSWW